MKKPLGRLFQYERIYCFPNKYGLMGFLLFLIMLAAAGTYQNNLIFMMSFLFLGLGLIAILQTARNIRNVEIARIQITPGFPGELTDVEITLKNPADDLKLNIEVRIRVENETLKLQATEIKSKDFTTLRGTIRLPMKRGVYPGRQIGLYTTYPYLLFNAWKYSKEKSETIVYPAPLGHELEQKYSRKIGEDFSGHKLYEPGDSLSRIDWKVFARRGEYHVRQFQDGGENRVSLTWDQTKNLGFEERLSQYSRWIVSAEEKSVQYDLTIPGFVSNTGIGKEHFEQCMAALARKTNEI